MAMIRATAGILTWGILLWGSLLVVKLPGDWGHALCGPWGCGPSMQALIGCHLAWFVLLAPPVVLLARRAGARRAGWALTAFGIVAVVCVIGYQRLVWQFVG